MFNVPDNDQLFKVHPFRIERNEEVIWIDVYEHLNPTSNTKFYAMPMDKPLTFGKPKKEHIKSGETIEEALNSCVTSTANLSCSDLFDYEKEK